ncbi:hypothetical protein [Mucilaginibacter jinjuensis]|uniref:Glycosyl-4,4'-diaponeurosporenoate acyltransferase n=1 Tax=Mucilaginibacter jinjuensis TaxID=1176721 RepID=A0ABY7T7U8_9SPHI|nr:hypothetical protein [Mucilaginibacter jinjuensis]WCT11931.1 hypothetical protein PQO05_24675 [Mucilaginibacter jinjuensis]
MRVDNNLSKIKRLLAVYNMALNVIWSALAFVPVFCFCYTLLAGNLLYTFMLIGIVPIFLPNAFFNKIQLGSTPVIYKKLGVISVNKLAQNGGFVNKLIRRKYPQYKAVLYQRSSINKLLAQTYINEKFHYSMLVFFALLMVYALIKAYRGWAAALFIINIAYNVYPILLQQYIRLKLKA